MPLGGSQVDLGAHTEMHELTVRSGPVPMDDVGGDGDDVPRLQQLGRLPLLLVVPLPIGDQQDLAPWM